MRRCVGGAEAFERDERRLRQRRPARRAAVRLPLLPLRLADRQRQQRVPHRLGGLVALRDQLVALRQSSDPNSSSGTLMTTSAAASAFLVLARIIASSVAPARPSIV